MDWGSTLSGAVSGGIQGFVMSGGNPYVAGAGALTGGYLGYRSGESRSKSANAQRSATDAAMKRLQMLSQQQYQNRMADLNKAMSFYGPARNALAAYGEATPELLDRHGRPPPGMMNLGPTPTRVRRGPFEG